MSGGLAGGCLCGATRYVAAGAPFHATVCHCGTCRRAAGAPMVAWFSVPRAGLRWVAGEPARYASSPGVERGFCARCGTSLTYAAAEFAQEIDVTTASLDDPEVLPPRDHTHAASRLRWVRLDAGLPAYAELRPGR